MLTDANVVWFLAGLDSNKCLAFFETALKDVLDAVKRNARKGVFHRDAAFNYVSAGC